MCGLAGYFRFNNNISEEVLTNMTDVIAHRGPNSSGLYQDLHCSLGHRRLSILDLSDRANQPMHSNNNRYVIVYNGEIYNFQEIGANLKENFKNDGTNFFKTSCDTEIVLETFALFGVDFIHQLNGMFAIVIYDKELNELYLFRDRLGIKPLFYYWDGNQFAFASEIKSILKISNLDFSINKKAVSQFLHMGFIPAPNSIYQKINKMLPGSWIKVNKDGIQEDKYWSIKQNLTNKIIEDKDEALVKISDLIASSVQYQLKSDVPFGVFLSGGIDSSLITAQSVSLSSVNVNTFSIGFEENNHNESQYAKAVANHLRTNHHEFIVSHKDAIQLFETVFDCFDEPFADASAIPTTLVSKLAKKYVTVTLSGEGGDELFLGYGAYHWARRLSNPLIKNFSPVIGNISGLFNSRFKRIASLLDLPEDNSIHSHIFSQEQYFFSRKEIYNLLLDDYKNVDYNLESWNSNSILLNMNLGYKSTSKKRKLSEMEKQSFFDINFYLPDDLLTKVDRCSMQYSLETRVPYLDHRLVEFTINLSQNLKYNQSISKYILKEILYQYLPKHLFDRPKQGFSIPLNKWLKKDLSYLIDEYLSEQTIKQFAIVDYEIVKSLINSYRGGKNDFLYNRIWSLIILHRWLKNKF